MNNTEPGMERLVITIADQDGVVLERLNYRLGSEELTQEQEQVLMDRAVESGEWPHDLTNRATRRGIGVDVSDALRVIAAATGKRPGPRKEGERA